MDASIKLGSIFGIPIRLHITFLLIFPLFVYIFSDPPSQTEILGMELSFRGLDADVYVKYAFGTIAAILFFAAILAHELAHSYLALRYGVKIRHITLMIFGGVSAMEEMPREPRQEWRMAFAGPFTSLVIGVVSWCAMILMRELGPSTTLGEGTTTLLGIVGFYNVLLAAFNLIPAFPMDGGRLLRSFYASRMPYLQATSRAARIGRYFAIAMGLYGLFTLNLWLIIIALFVYIGASEEEQSTTVMEALQGLTVGQLMTDTVQVVHPSMSVAQLHELMLSTRHMGFPVVDRGLVGIVTLGDTQKVPREYAPFATVRDIMTTNVVTVPPSMDAARALAIMSEKKIGRLVVMDGPNLVGIVTQKDFLRAVNVMSLRMRSAQPGHGPAPPPLPPQQPQAPSPPAASS